MPPATPLPQSPSAWRLDQHTAHLASPILSAQIDLARPDAGCQHAQFRGQSLGLAHWLAVKPSVASAPIAIEDSFSRGDDLVATYAESPAWPIRWQVYWRLLDADALGPALAGIELIVSAQTSLLDSLPALRVETVLAGAIASVHQASTVRAPLPGTKLSYLQLIHPADNQGTEIDQPPGQLTIRHPLFLRSLEKGVILRARLRGLILDQTNQESTAQTCAALIRDSPTPLTV
jgi:hypothetical protein